MMLSVRNPHLRRAALLGLLVILLLLAGGPSITTISGQEAEANRLMPDDLVYLGAFRLPYVSDETGWLYSGAAMTYYPDGDPDGPDDGFPGSIFATGHDWYQEVSEINIPMPVISAARSIEALNTAETLQPFHSIRADLFDEFEIPRAGLAYLPPQGQQSSGKLYFAWAQHMGEGETNPSHGWSELDLSDPQPAGPWRIGEYWNYVSGDYLFAIPTAWADQYTPGLYLATGRYRDGGQGTQGPSILAIAPWLEGNPPAPGSTLPATPLLYYGSVYEEGSPTLNNYCPADEWNGAVWLTAGERAAVIFAGTKGTGECWYGCADGTVWEEPYPEEGCPERGWWSTTFAAQLLFYDPADLAAVTQGTMQPWEPQPYAVFTVDDLLFNLESPQQKYLLGAASFDEANGLLYVFELFGDGDQPLIHVWQVGA